MSIDSAGVTDDYPASVLWRDYYSFGGAMAAMKEGVISSATRTLTYLYGDHPSTSLRAGLGSDSLTIDAGGNVVSQQRYKPGACPFASLRATCGLVVTVAFLCPPNT
jgi:hypothetical protein